MFISPYEKIGGLVWFPRMLRKIRLRGAGKLPADYHPYMGTGFDGRCIRFLRVDYDALVNRVLAGGTDEEILEWCFATGYRPTANEVLVWNEYMTKRGWRDTDAPPSVLRDYKEKYGLGHRDDIMTFFDFYEVDEGRRP
ncbi:MAG TPA: DUF5069 domain-containing protein [Rhizobium sp.]|nr:DUF5069 domain-containing protein [Rhizobium sp.]